MSEKKYVKGSFKEINTQFGSMIKLSFKPSELLELAKNPNAKGYVNLVLSKRKDASQYGDTHSLCVDDYVATTKSEPVPSVASGEFNEDNDDASPF